MQEITLIGRLGRDAGIHEMQNGSKFMSLTVAADGRYKGETYTSWYDVLTFDVERYKNMLQYFTKGTSVVVVGELYCEVEVGNDGVARCRRNVTAHNISFNRGSSNASGTTTGDVVVAATSSPKKGRAAAPVQESDDIQMSSPKPAAPVAQAQAQVQAPVAPVTVADASDDLPF